MEKPKYIEASFTQTISFDVEDINFENVADYWVKWCKLHIQMKDGSIIEIDDAHEYDIDWKHPDDDPVMYDENHYQIEFVSSIAARG